jgi:hypothetical protein
LPSSNQHDREAFELQMDLQILLPLGRPFCEEYRSPFPSVLGCQGALKPNHYGRVKTSHFE